MVTFSKVDDLFCAVMSTDKRNITYNFKSAWECRMWVYGIRKAIESDKEIKRTLNGVLKYNAALLYEHYEARQEEEITKMIAGIIEPVKVNMKIQEFIDALKTVSKELNFFYDAFYARKPFSIALFEFVSIQAHKTLRERIFGFWTKNGKNMNAAEIIGFMNSVSLYERTLKSWGVEDSRFTGWVDPLLKTFISKVFDNCKTMLTNILYDQRNKFYLEKNRIVSRSSEGLESQLTFIFDHYNQVPSLEAADLLLGTCANIMLLFLMNTRNFLREDKFPLQIYIAIINNSFLKVIKNFQKRVHTSTKSQLSLKQIRVKIDEDFLVSLISEIEKMCFQKISQYIAKEVAKEFKGAADVMTLTLKDHLENLVANCNKVIDMVENRYLASDLAYDVLEYSINLYYKKFLEYAPKVNGKNFEAFKEKVRQDFEVTDKLLEEYELEKEQQIHFRMEHLNTFVETDNLDKALISVINMNVLYPDIIEYSNIDKLVKLKLFFTKQSKEYMTNYLKKSLDDFKARSAKKNNLMFMITVQPKVNRFIRNLSRVIRESGRN